MTYKEYVDDEMMLDGLTDREIEMMLEDMYYELVKSGREIG